MHFGRKLGGRGCEASQPLTPNPLSCFFFGASMGFAGLLLNALLFPLSRHNKPAIVLTGNPCCFKCFLLRRH